MSPLARALYHAVHDHAAGVESLARDMGLAASTLRCMANPNDATHEWSLKRFRQVLDLTGNRRPLEELAAEFGGVFIPMPRAEGATLSELLRALLKLSREFGDVPREVEKSLKDDRITVNELERIRREVVELQAAAAAVLQEVEARTLKPPTARERG